MTELYATDPEKWLEEKANAPDLFCIIIFRGAWCKYDKYYLRRLGKHFKPMMDQESISLVAWTSQGAEAAKQADAEWGLTKDCGFKQVLGDDTNALANHLVDDVILPNLLTKTPEEVGLKASDLKIPDGAYPNGMVQPGIVWYAHHGSAPVFEWSHKCDNESQDKSGALRPDPADMWTQVLKRKHALDHGSAVMPSHTCKMCTTDMEVATSQCQIL